MNKKFKYNWEEAIKEISDNPEYKQLLYHSYLTWNLDDNCKRYYNSNEFKNILQIIKKESPDAKNILDLAAGNGIASYAFAISGYDVTAIEPDSSNLVGRGAIEKISREFNLKINIIDSYAENINITDNFFDIIFVRQALHHASDLDKMLKEIERVLKNGGVFIAIREHVVTNYKKGLKKFFDSHPLHKLYGGENAYRYSDYLKKIEKSGLKLLYTIKPFDNEINLSEGSFSELKEKIINSKIGIILKLFLPENFVYNIGLSILKMIKKEGELYSFIARKVDS